MALDDLDLEFEDEEEAKKKKNDAVQVDVDLEFQAPVGGGKPRPVVKPTGATPPPQSAGAPRAAAPPGTAEVRKIDEARAAAGAPVKRPVAAAASVGRSGPVSSGANALNSAPIDDLDSLEVVELRNHVQKVEFEAAVKVGIAEYKAELLSEVLSDVKLLDHQITQLLSRINSKYPETKQDALLIKKLLADFLAKKRK